jgi:hypothetical protein
LTLPLVTPRLIDVGRPQTIIATRSRTATALALLLLGAGCTSGVDLLGDGEHDVVQAEDAGGGADGGGDVGGDAEVEADADVGMDADVALDADSDDGGADEALGTVTFRLTVSPDHAGRVYVDITEASYGGRYWLGIQGTGDFYNLVYSKPCDVCTCATCPRCGTCENPTLRVRVLLPSEGIGYVWNAIAQVSHMCATTLPGYPTSYCWGSATATNMSDTWITDTEFVRLPFTLSPEAQVVEYIIP